jgi:hypothetical protein
MTDTTFAIFSGNPQDNQFGAGYKKSKHNSEGVDPRIKYELQETTRGHTFPRLQ